MFDASPARVPFAVSPRFVSPAALTSWLAAVALVLASVVAYHNTLSLPFVFDDQVVVLENSTIRQLWPLGPVLSTPTNGSGAAGRPLLNLSFALNYAFGGFSVRSYHVVNLLLHASSVLLLFALVRRTLLRPVLADRFGAAALPVAFVTALLWAVHPLNTESVTCVSQRTELLVAFFYLLTPLALVCSVDSPRPGRWHTLAVISCLLGMASKEVMATMPLVALLYDRTFLAGTFTGAWRQRRGLYVGLMSTWLLLAALVLMMGGSRGEAAGFGLGMTPWSYALKQCEAIIQYLRLAFWPSPLVLDYGTDVVQHAREVVPQGLALLTLLALTAYALVRRPVLGFLGAWFFIILGPSSSFIPLVAQTMAEHRMYLPLIAVVALVVALLFRWFGRAALVACVAPAVVFGAMTIRRNDVYQTELGLWRDTALKRPTNPRAHLCHGLALMKSGNSDDAVAAFLQVLLLDPTHATANNSLGQIFSARGWYEDAVEHYLLALEGKDNHAAVHSNLCDAYRALGQLPKAIEHGEAAVRLDPKLAPAEGNLGLALANAGREADAIPHYEAAIRLDPNFSTAHNNLGVALLNAGRLAEAKQHLERALQLDPNLVVAHNTLGAVFDRLGQKPAARAQFELALRLQPNFEAARRNLAALEGASPRGERAR